MAAIQYLYILLLFQLEIIEYFVSLCLCFVVEHFQTQIYQRYFNMRQTTFDDIVGQENAKRCIRILINDAVHNNNVIPHILMDGPPGTGKTSLCHAIANEFSSNVYIANGASIDKVKDIAQILLRLNKNDILFIDEVHKVGKKAQNSLLTIMEDFVIDMSAIGQTMKLPKFTLIGATTHSGMLLGPMRDRFVIRLTLEEYSNEEMRNILLGYVRKAKLRITDQTLNFLCLASRGVPRYAVQYVDWLSRYIQTHRHDVVNSIVAKEALLLLGVDSNGFTSNDRTYLDFVKKIDKPTGISTIISGTNIARETIEHIIEPYLIRRGILIKTPKGRVIR